MQLSLRRQQVSEKLNEWTVFSEKYKELCEWLTNMESKVSQNGDISIEEMIEKLRKVNHDGRYLHLKTPEGLALVLFVSSLSLLLKQLFYTP